MAQDPILRIEHLHKAFGDNVVIEGAIVDKNVQIGDNVVISNPNNVQDTAELGFGMIRDGVTCVVKTAVLPQGWSLVEALK